MDLQTHVNLPICQCHQLFGKNHSEIMANDNECLKSTSQIILELPFCVKHFTNIKSLILPQNRMKIINFLPPQLEHLTLNENHISNINKSVFPSTLQSLNLSHNRLVSLDITNTNVEYLYVNYNKLNHLRIGRRVHTLIINNNPLDFIDFNDNDSLRFLNMRKCNLDQLQLLPSTVTHLNISSNNIESLQCLPINIQQLNCSSNKIKSFECIYPRLDTLHISGNNLTQLICDEVNSFKTIYCCSNKLRIIRIKGNLRELICRDNPLEIIQVENMCAINSDESNPNTTFDISNTYIDENGIMHLFI